MNGPKLVPRYLTNILLANSVKRVIPSSLSKPSSLVQIRCNSTETQYIRKPIGQTVVKHKGNIPKIESISVKDIELEDEEAILDDREFADLKVEDYETLYAEDKTGATKTAIEKILAQYEDMKYNTVGRVPSQIDLIDMKRLLEEGSTPTNVEKLLHFLFKRETDKRATERRRLKLKEFTKKKIDEKRASQPDSDRTGLLDNDGNIVYGLWHNSLFCRVAENKLKSGSSDTRLRAAALYGPKLVFDFGYEKYMSDWHSRNVIDQLVHSYGLNRFNYLEPFDLWLCNYNPDTLAGSYLSDKALRHLYTNSMISVTNDCFTRHFEKSRLVYLSPNAQETLTEVGKNDDVYVIGLYNDKGRALPLSLRKADQLGIRSRKLPIDKYISWQHSSKSLCINHVTGILLEAYANGNDWDKAFHMHIPSRKIKPEEVIMEEMARRLEKIESKRRRRGIDLKRDFEF